MKYYLIGAFNHGGMAQTYFDSLSVLGDSVEPIVIQYLRNGVFEPVNKPENVTLIKFKKEYPGNTGKHKDFREIISPLLEEDTWCFFTDMHDVVFQAPLPELPDADVLIASEHKKFLEIDQWNGIFPQKVMDWEVYNVGCFAMKRDTIREFWEYLYKNFMDFYSWYKYGDLFKIGNEVKFPFNIPAFHKQFKTELALMFNGKYDTLCFNEFIRTKKRTEVPGIFACYAYSVEMGRVQDIEGKLYVNGKLSTLAHFNGTSDKYLRRYEKI